MKLKQLCSGALCAALLGSLLVLPARAVTATVVKPDETPLAGAKVTCQIKENGAWRDWASESYKIEGDLDGDGDTAPDYSGLKEGAEDHGQSPSMFTDDNGRCGWMLPKGTFRFKVTAEGYQDFTSPEFTVGTESGNKNNSDSLGQLKLTAGSGDSGSTGTTRPGGGSSYMPWLNNSGGSSDPAKPEPTKPPAAELRPGSLKADAASIRYLAGYDDGTFRPNQPITRYEVAQALTYLLVLGDGTKAEALSDVAPEHAAAVSRLVEAGLINGMGDGTFRGEDSLTRAELAALLNRVAGRKDVAGQAPEYTDVPAKFWGYEDVKKASLPLPAAEGT